MKKIRVTYWISSVLLINVVHAQQMHLFSDTLQKLRPASPGQIINNGIYSYISNSSTDGDHSTASTIIKVDTSGKTIWTAYPTNFIASGIEPVNIGFTQFILGSDNNLYAWMNYGKLAKIRASNGSIDWMVPLTPVVGSPAILVDYDMQTVVYASTTVSVNTVRLIRYSKAKGENLGYVDLRCPGQGTFGIHVATNGNIFLASRDSCYKYTSFDNPAFEWKVRMCTGTDRFYPVQDLAQDGNNLFIYGSKESGFKNGMVSCIDISNGTLKWFVKNGGSFDFYYADHKVKNGALYTSWRHAYVGSISEKCFVNKIDINTGTKTWEFNHAFRTQPVNVSKAEAMVSMDIDNNETIYLTGYGLPDNQAAVSWAFMKIRGRDGTVLKRSFVPASDITQDFPGGFTARLIGDKIYTTGIMPGNVAGGSVDTLDLVPRPTHLYKSNIQYTSSVVSIANVSANKKMIVKKIGKSLKVAVVDALLNKISEKTLGDTLDPYEGIDRLGTNDTSGITFVPYYKYANASNNHFYFSQVANPETFNIVGIDTTGTIFSSYSRLQSTSIMYPYQFFQDSVGRTWFSYVAGSSVNSSIFPYVSMPGVVGISGQWTARPYKLLKPTTYFPYTKDTVLLFSEPVGRNRKASLSKLWQGYLPVANAYYWFWSSLDIRWFNSVEREGKDNFYVAAKDSSLRDLIFKYRLTDSTLLWTKRFDSTILTLKGYELNGSFYALSTQGNDVFIRKFKGTNGDVVWTKSIAAPVGHIFKVGDFAMSKQRQKITIVGHIIDTVIKTMSKIHIVTFDTSGNAINTFTKDGYGAWQNKATSITIGQDGQTLVSGQITDSVYGYAGFIYEVDASTLIPPIPTPVINDIISPVCSSTTTQTGKLLNPVAAPYTISIMIDNTTAIPYNAADSSFNYSVTDTGYHTIRVTYAHQSSSSFKDTSFVVKLTPAAGAMPTQNGNVLTAPATGGSYQWYDGAAAMAGKTEKTLAITQNGNYSYTYTVDGCISPSSPPLNAVFTSLLDPTNNNAVISFFPNPTSGMVIINNLNPAYQYGLRIIDHNGKQVNGLTNLARGSSAEVNMWNLQPGTYVLQLWNQTKKVLIGNQQIVLVR
ncbi:T9SS type A sorting domain-containing protein [Terrimonas pollutisoli]|uniref:T9SS type A sorting domain-containing protein n=1 Tax=Terrimonas pollutisoli TaxID=3034147 RepID=UPI0023EC2365|nr:T9SS type A sorting domain-containing protein [Terrimonas sp. H1YJ31]